MKRIIKLNMLRILSGKGEKMVLNRRIIRELSHNLARYAAFFFLLVFGIVIIVGMVVSSSSIIKMVENSQEQLNVEDGEFTLTVPLKEDNIDLLEEHGVTIQNDFYFDIKLKDSTVLRIFKNRENINLLNVEKGIKNCLQDQLILEKLYASANKIELNDKIKLFDKEYNVCGFASTPDYCFVKKNVSDVSSNIKEFSVGFLSKEAFDDVMMNNKGVIYNYNYKLSDSKGDDNYDDGDVLNYLLELPQEESFFKEYIDSEFEMDMPFVNTFIPKEDNPRINGYKDDTMINHNAAMAVGVVFFFLVAYVLAVFSAHNIAAERKQIGTLYAVGYTKAELTRHYLVLPFIITMLGCVAGTVLGYFMVPYFSESSTTYYSYPVLQNAYPIYLFVYAVVLPPVVTLCVNTHIIWKKLSEEPLSLLRGGESQDYSSQNEADYSKFKFLTAFRLRQVSREKRTMVVLMAGVMSAIFLLVFSFTIYCSITNYAERITDGMTYDYMYQLKRTLKEEPDKDAEKAFMKSLKYEYQGYKLDIVLLGIEEDSEFFDISFDDKKNSVVLSDSLSMKLKIKDGDKFILSDGLKETDYAFAAEGVINYANGLYVFMDIENMRKLFEVDHEYYNGLLSNKELDLNEDFVVSVINSDDIKETADSFAGLMASMIIMLLVISVVLFVIVIFILMKNSIERSVFSISLIKVFGYSISEIKKLYINSLFYFILLAAVIGIPLSKLVLNSVYPILILNFNSGMKTVLTWPAIGCILAVIFISYFVVILLLTAKIKKVSLVEILKTRE